MKKFAAILAVLMVFSILCDTADARWRPRRRRNRTYTNYTYVNVWGDAKTDQDRCQAEANYMAKHGCYYHVGGLIGSFEGWGASYGGTCQPGSGMTCTGAASARRPNGVMVWVRSWR